MRAEEREAELFSRALELAEDERADYLELACEGDRDLRARIEELLASAIESDAFFGRAPSELLEGPRADRPGPWRLLRVLAAGGMGTVWLAERGDGQFQMTVALKLLRRGMDTDDILARFRSEREVLARLDHPNIARLIDGGATDRGLPYLVMEYIDGVPIDRYCDEHRLGLTQRLELFRGTCEAVEYAHHRLVVHRDLKPSNILVTRAGTPKLLDFGIAKVLRPEGGARTMQVTATEARLLTPEYASPEQVRGEPITTATDVYSLGVVLYELLTGKRPHQITTRSRADLERAICELEPERPSTVVGRRAEGNGGGEGEQRAVRHGVAWQLRRRLQGDLDTILLMALRKEPERRYGSVAALSDDVRRHLEGQPVAARPATLRYRTAKFVRRNRVLVGAVIGVFASLCGGLSLSTWLYFQADAARGLAEERSIEADRRRSEAERKTYVASIAAAEAALQAHDVAGARASLEGTAAEMRGWEWRHFWSRLDQSEATLAESESSQMCVALDPGGAVLASGDSGGTITLRDFEDGTLLATMAGDIGAVQDLAYSPDGEWLFSSSEDGIVRIWSVRERVELARLPGHENNVRAVAVAPDCRSIASAGRDRLVRVWERIDGDSPSSTPSFVVRAEFSGHEGLSNSLDWSPDGTRLASGGDDGRICIWSATSTSTPELVARHGVAVLSVRFAGDGRQVLSAGWDGTLKLWDATSGAELRTLHGHEKIACAVFSADGSRIASCSWDRTVRLWEAPSGKPLAIWLGHRDNVREVAFDSLGERVVSCGADGAIKIWSPRSSGVSVLRGRSQRVYGLAASRDGVWIASGHGVDAKRERNAIVLWDLRHLREVGVLHADERAGVNDIRAIATSPDGRYLAAGVDGFSICLWDASELSRLVRAGTPGDALPGPAARLTGHTDWVAFLLFDRTGRRLVSSSSDGSVRVWNVDARGLESVAYQGSHPIRYLALSPDGSRLAVSTPEDREIAVIDLDGDRQIGRLAGHTDGATAVAFSPDGRWIASGSNDGTLRLWTAATLSEHATLSGHPGIVKSLVFSPDGSRLVSGSADSVVKLWDVGRAEEVATLHGHAYEVTALAFSPDGTTLYSGSGDDTIRIWRAPRGGDPPEAIDR